MQAPGGANIRAMRRAVPALVVALALVGAFTGGLAWLLNDPGPPGGAGRGERLWYARCVECHGVDGRGAWRAALFLIRPGDLTEQRRMSGHSDDYLATIIKNGGAPLGRPGMPAFGSALSDADVEALVGFVRGLSAPSGSRRE